MFSTEQLEVCATPVHERIIIALIAAACLLSQAARAFEADTPVTPGTSLEARALLNFFAQTYGKKIIAGQHDGWRLTNGLSAELAYITNTTGKLPSLLENDLAGYTAPQYDNRHRLAKKAIDWTQKQHGISAFCWHWRPPSGGASAYAKDTTFDISQAVSPGTPEYIGVQRDLDAVASELEVIRDAHVPVLWRPLHEANGRWFWWGAHGPEPFKQLWQMMFENFTGKHHLNNLIWVFSPGAETDLAAWYPGDAYVDIVGDDHYPMDGNHQSAKDIYDELSGMTRGRKLIALGENGPIPDPALVQHDHAGWLFFTTWSGSILFDKTTAPQLREYYGNPYVLTLSNMPALQMFASSPEGKAYQLGFVGSPGDAAIGGKWRMPISVAVQDEAGRTVREGTFTVNLKLASSGAAESPDFWTATSVNGVATFADVSLNAAMKQCQFVASAEQLLSATSAVCSIGPGNGLMLEEWTGDANFSAPPDSSKFLSTALEMPVEMATNVMIRIRGLVIAPQSGEYRFSMASGAASELWLGQDESPDSAAKLITIDGRTPYRKWPHINEADSPFVRLTAGREYYFEIRRWQRQGSTQLHVRWQLPDGTEERPIPAYRFKTLK